MSWYYGRGFFYLGNFCPKNALQHFLHACSFRSALLSLWLHLQRLGRFYHLMGFSYSVLLSRHVLCD